MYEISPEQVNRAKACYNPKDWRPLLNSLVKKIPNIRTKPLPADACCFCRKNFEAISAMNLYQKNQHFMLAS